LAAKCILQFSTYPQIKEIKALILEKWPHLESYNLKNAYKQFKTKAASARSNLKKWIFHHTQVELPSVLDAYQKKVEEEEIPYTRKVKLLMALCKAGKLTVDNATVLPGTTLATLPAEGGANRGGGEDEDENNDDDDDDDNDKKPKKIDQFWDSLGEDFKRAEKEEETSNNYDGQNILQALSEVFEENRYYFSKHRFHFRFQKC